MRDDSVSIAKGIAIILMVMAHARCPLWWQYHINMFHMPLFFFFSALPFIQLVSLSIIWIYGLSITQLAEFLVIEKYAYSGWWGGYFVIGLFAQLTFVNLCILLKNKINW